MKSKRLVLFTGMGGDHRLYRHIKVAGAELVTPDHVEPTAGESLASYASRIAYRFDIQPSDVVGGISFGGMIAGEISKQRPVSGLILLGSCLRPSTLPWTYKWAEKIGRYIPDFVFRFRSWGPLSRWRFAPLTTEAEECIAEMAKTYPMSQLRAFGRMALDWSGVEHVSCPMLSIHGDRDRIIPLHSAETSIILKDAGHAFTLTHAEQTVTEITRFLNGIS